MPLLWKAGTDLQILGWSVSYPLHVYNIMPDFRTGSPALLDLLQNIGRSYLRAVYLAIPMTTPITGSTYMTFSPLSTVYNAPGTAGSYVSTVSNVADFLYYYEHLTVVSTSRAYLILAIIYDFMAYCAQYYHRVLQHRPASIRQLVSARTALRCSLTSILGTIPHTQEYENLTKIMFCIRSRVSSRYSSLFRLFSRIFDREIRSKSSRFVDNNHDVIISHITGVIVMV